MFSLPSMWNLIISTIVFFIVAWYVRRFLDGQDFSNGKKTGHTGVYICLPSVMGCGRSGGLGPREDRRKKSNNKKFG